MALFSRFPDYRMKTPTKPLVTFEEQVAGAPPAIKAWFYPGDNYGNQFVYPKAKAQQLAQKYNQNVPSMADSLASNTTSATPDPNEPKVAELKQTDIMAQKPSGDEVRVAEVFLVVASPRESRADRARAATAPPADNASPGDAPQELPKTASMMPEFLLAGITLVVAGFILRASQRPC